MIKAIDIKQFQENIDKWVWTKQRYETQEEFNEMVEVHRKDRSDLSEILDLVKEGKYKEAGTNAGNLDTIVRDEIPQNVWDIIGK